MKKQISFALCLVLLLSFCLSFTACGDGPSISYGDAYVGERSVFDDWQAGEQYIAYYFYSDGTGKQVRYQDYHSPVDASFNYVLSVTIEFIWAEASNGGVYLFETKVIENENDTYTSSVSLSRDPIYFFDDFLVCGNDDVARFVREGSELFDILKAANAEAKK
jgi:hypothetical protein